MKNLVDTHIHLYDKSYDEDRNEIIEQINDKLDFVVNISCDYESSMKCINYSKENEKMYATIGYHPCDISSYNEDKMIELLELSKSNKKIVALGEIGLDYYWMIDPKEKQIEIFEKQIEYAIKYDLPIIIHSRDSLEDVLKILRKYEKARGILHCYSGSYEEVKDLLDRFYIGIGGTSTFKNNKITHKLIEDLDLKYMVIETDSPYLTPIPYRGKRNNPIYVEYVVKKISELKNIDLDEVKKITTENAMKVYNICIK